MRRGIIITIALVLLLSGCSGLATTTTSAPSLLVMIPVPTGTFQRDSNAANKSTVSAFSMSETEVTRAQWTAVTGLPDPSDAGVSTGTGDPVQNANWYHALVFCNTLSMREGLTPVYTINGSTNPTAWGTVPIYLDNDTWDAAIANWSATGYRLPTEMEWMWAAMGARDGTTGYQKPFAGSTGSNSIGDHAWYSESADGTGPNAEGATHPVGAKTANELGLHDMSGNVWEWCWDWIDDGTWPNYAITGALTNYRGAASGASRVVRGGGWYDGASNCAVVEWAGNNPDGQRNGIGFRVVRP